MGRLTAKNKEKLANEILELLKEHDLNTDVRIYFAKKCLTGNGGIVEDVKGSDYFRYANDDTLSMTFEGGFYGVINWHYSELARIVIPAFDRILNTYGLYYELGDAWNLATYYIDSELAKKPKAVKEGKTSRNPIYIRHNDCPASIEPIRAEWGRLQNEHGDGGSCVMGAGFTFKYKGLYYKMPPQGRWQGSCSWEASRHVIKSMLLEAECKELSYDFGRMD